MPQDATCTACKHVFPVTESRTPFSVPCPKCEADLTVEFKKPATPPEAGQPPYELLVQPGALPDARPAAVAKKRTDDDDEEPVRKGGSAMVVLLSGGLGLLFVLGGLSLTGWYLFTQVDVEDTSTSSNSRNTRRSNNNDNRDNGNNIGRPFPNKGNNGGNGGRPFNKPKDTTFDLRPVSGQVPKISPPPASIPASATIELGSRVGAIAVGGGGRYIAMHMPDKGQLILFDANTAQTSVTEVDRGNVLLAAGLSKLVIYVPGQKIFRIYSLPNLAKQFDASVGMIFDLGAIAMGNRTDGPLVGCNGFGEVFLYNLRGNTLTEVEAARVKPGIHGGKLRAAPDGNAFVSFEPHMMGRSVKLLTEEGSRWRVRDLGPTPFPSADDYFYGNGVVLDRNNRDQRFGGIGVGSNTWYVPATSGNGYFLKIAPTTIGKRPRETRTFTVTVHAKRNANTPVAEMPEYTNLPDFVGLAHRWQPQPADGVALDEHFFLIPEAQLLVTLSHNRQKLYLRRLDAK